MRRISLVGDTDLMNTLSFAIWQILVFGVIHVFYWQWWMQLMKSLALMCDISGCSASNGWVSFRRWSGGKSHKILSYQGGDGTS